MYCCVEKQLILMFFACNITYHIKIYTALDEVIQVWVLHAGGLCYGNFYKSQAIFIEKVGKIDLTNYIFEMSYITENWPIAIWKIYCPISPPAPAWNFAKIFGKTNWNTGKNRIFRVIYRHINTAIVNSSENRSVFDINESIYL